MVVERADTRTRTAVRTKDPRRLFTGDRTWSTLEPGTTVELTLEKIPLRVAGFSKVVRRDPESDETIHFFDVAVYAPGDSDVREHRIVSGDAINKPGEPWYGIVRYTKPQNADK